MKYSSIAQFIGFHLAFSLPLLLAMTFSEWSNIHLKACDVCTVRFLKNVWLFFNIVQESVNSKFGMGTGIEYIIF